jgi:hypothetical protein
MTELEKFQLVNACETCEALEQAIILIGEDNNGQVMGRTRPFDAARSAQMVKPIVHENLLPNYLTRSFGIRQQALYLRFYLNPQL